MCSGVWVNFILALVVQAGSGMAGAAGPDFEGAGPLISEFMASNASRSPLQQGDLLDAEGDSVDWIEISNPTQATLSLDGWFLTDDPLDLTRWRFPQVTLGPGGFLIVFASAKDRAVVGSELHTNFKLDGGGEYLALVGPDGVTVRHEYTPAYPSQLTGLSYGLSSQATKLVSSGADATCHVPKAGEAGPAWTHLAFDDSAWDKASTTVGFSASPTLTGQDIGSPAKAGSYTVEAGAFAVAGGGQDIWNSSDQFFFVYQRLSGDGQITSRVKGIDNTDPWSKAGVMMRESLDPGSKNVMADVTSANGVSFQRRTATGGGGTHTTIAGLSAPYWVRLVRQGDTFTGYRSADGKAWTPMDSDVIPMDRDITVGLAVTSHNNAGPLCKAVFDNLTLSSDGLTDLKKTMLGVNASLWMRIPFVAQDVESLGSLTLALRYEDAFVAYLNGVEVARDNSKAAAPTWNSAADTNRPNGLASQALSLDLSSHLGALIEGRNVLAIQAMNDATTDPEFLISPELTASDSLTRPQYFTSPTPGRPNGSGALGLVPDVVFSHGRGFYDAPFAVTITCDTPGVSVRCTTDGSEPTDAHGEAVTGPIRIAGTTTLRARAVKPGWMSSPVVTHTYVFASDMARQPVMSRTITEDPRWAPQIQNGLVQLPMVSLAVSKPITESEVKTSVELIFPDATAGFQVDAGVELFGGTSLGHPKDSMRISFKRAYGPTQLRFDLFGRCPFGGDTATDAFDQVLLRSGSHDAMFWIQPGTGAKGTFVRNRWMFDRQLEMGQPAPRSRFVHVMINAVYWGLYQLMERPNGAFMASYFGGDAEDYDAVKGDYGNLNILNGDSAEWYAMVASTAHYETLQKHMDVVNYADYLLVNFYGGNDWDWKPYQNWMAARRRQPGAGYLFFCWDNDVILRTGPNANAVNQGGPGGMWDSIRRQEDFRMLLADRAQRYFFNRGMLTRERVSAQWDDLAREIDLAIIPECARWGVPEGYTPTVWRDSLNWVKTIMVPQRAETLIEQMRAAGVFPVIDAPACNLQEGSIERGTSLVLTAPQGRIYYSLDGSDPRPASSGEVKPGTTTLVAEEAAKRVLVPSGPSAEAWKGGARFDDSAWTSSAGSPGGVGYERSSGYEGLLSLDLAGAMYGLRPGCYVRIHFQADVDPATLRAMTLTARYDDGFVAYLNGVEIHRIAVDGTPAWDSLASIATESAGSQAIDVSDHLQDLREGENVLAIHALNASLTSSDLLIQVSLTAGQASAGARVSVTAAEYKGPIPLTQDVHLKARALSGSTWSAMTEVVLEVTP